jgi:hypothetical protein
MPPKIKDKTGSLYMQRGHNYRTESEHSTYMATDPILRKQEIED